jgi:DNA-binding transcriptional MerR regulator
MNGEGGHLSIGEVLSLLRDEFPDITVSKIRFLESQGLINPERTPSGYRKFYEPDVERLRWILRQQREYYLPLKVIKGRLGQIENGDESADEPEPAEVARPASRAHAPAATAAVAPASGAPQPARVTGIVTAGPSDAPKEREEQGELTGASFTRAELVRAAGLDDHELAELESYGLLPEPRQVGRTVLFDESALEIARLARGFLRHGVEARHLRMYKSFAEREASLYTQVVAPLLKQRNPQAKQRAQETATELARLGRALRAAMLRGTIDSALHE